MPNATLLVHHAADPYFNMACDEWMAAHADSSRSILIRLYSWQPGGITIGRHQREERALRWDLLHGTPVIRRITGGRAIYHDPSELTYAVAMPTDGGGVEQLAGSVAAVSRTLSEVLSDFVTALGIEARVMSRSAPGEADTARLHTAPCFTSYARREILADGRKVVASAQRRMGQAVLQHGSVKLAGIVGHAALPDIPGSPNQMADAVTRSDIDTAKRLFANAFETRLGLSVVARELSADERGLVARYASYVASHHLRQRDSIKQIASLSSLSLDRL